MRSKQIEAPKGRTAEKLNEALPAIAGTYLVLSGPGTGKTTLLTERVRQILADPQTRKSKVLALTFTNKAATEMKSRLNSLIPDLESRAFIGTFHGFGNHVLRAHGHAVGIPADFVIYDERDQVAMLKQLQEEGRVPEGLNLESLVQAFSRLKSRGLLGDLKSDDASEISPHLRALYETYHSAMRAANALDFGDLILESVRLSRERPQILRLYQVAYEYMLVDEFQDTTPAQYELVKLLAGTNSPNLFAVADEDQLIYEWNEARLETLNHLCNDFRAKVIYSTLTHRCPPNVVEAANAVISHNRLRFAGKPEIRSRRKESEPIWLYEAQSEEEEAAFVASVVRQLREDGYRLNDVAVIGRARRLLDTIETELLGANIPAARPSLAGLGGSEEAQTVLRLLRWLQNSTDEQSARHVIGFLRPQLSDAFEQVLRVGREAGIGVEAVLAGEESDEAGNDLRGLLENIAKWRPLVRDTRRLLEELREGLPALLEESPEDGSAEELRRVIEGLETLRQSMSARTRLGLPDFLLGLPQVVGSSARCLAPSREGVVSLLTYHQAKGLEFGVVFLVALEAGVFPDFRSEKDLRRMEEERRLFYVGITRTKSRLYLTYSRKRRGVRGSFLTREPSPFLSEIPKHLIQLAQVSTLTNPDA